MQLEQRYKVTFSRSEVTTALKAHFPHRLPVQVLPSKGDEVVTMFLMSADGDSLVFSWVRIVGAGPA